MMKKTTVAKSNRAAAAWYVVDASQETLGRMASRVAQILQGKHKPIYTPHVDTGDYVVVINAADVQVTGAKKEKKIYRHHTGHPGGLVEQSFKTMRERHPEDIVRLAVRRMLPKTNLGRAMIRKLKVYRDNRHEHHAQNPQPLSFGTGRE
jgi:large subunit ribosomal protein L13